MSVELKNRGYTVKTSPVILDIDHIAKKDMIVGSQKD